MLLAAALLSVAALGAAPKRGRIIGLRVRGDADVAVIEVQGDRPLSFTTLRLTATNLANKVALYNFLSTFSGTHFVAPRSYALGLGFVF